MKNVLKFLAIAALVAAFSFTACENTVTGTYRLPKPMIWTAVADSTFSDSIIHVAYGGTAGSEKWVAVGASGKMAYWDE
jgi:hypothetical protein